MGGTGAMGGVQGWTGASGRWQVHDVIDGQYEVWGVHEQGGMGLVYRVLHRQWGIFLAVKTPRPELLTTDGFLDRFVAEAETWVSLGLHPHVCACHYVRTLDGVPRVFSEYVGGGSIADRIREGRLYEGGEAAAQARIVDFAIQLAWGLDHAHGRGLVHQDVKPGNVLVGLDGTVKVTDFGLARAGKGHGFGTGTGSPTGVDRPGGTVLVTHGGLTLAYASPEQAAGERVGRRSDIYSFAVSVLEMFTGEVTWLAGPAAEEALAEFRAQSASGGQHGRSVMPDVLAGLLARCLRQDPARRPASLADVAGVLVDLYEQLTGTPYPRPVPTATDLRADELNNRALSLLDLGRSEEAERAFEESLAADPRHLAATYNLGLHQWRGGVLLDDEFIARLESLRADTGTDPWWARYLLAQVHLERGDHDSARSLLDEMDHDRPGARESAALRRVLEAGRGTTVRTEALPGRGGWTRRRLSADGNTLLAGGSDGRIRLGDLPSGECRHALEGHDKEIVALDIDAAGRRAVSADADGVVRQWDLVEGRGIGLRGPGVTGPRPHRVSELRLTPDARTAAAVLNGRLVAWDFPDGRWYRASDPAVQTEEFTALELSADGSRALTVAGARTDTLDHMVQAWELATARCLWRLPEKRQVNAMALSADGRRAVLAVIAGPRRHEIQVWDIDRGRLVRSMTGPGWIVTTLTLSPDGRFALAAVEEDRRLRLWDLDKGRCLRTFHGRRADHRGPLISVGNHAAVVVDEDEARWLSWDPPGMFTAAPALGRPRRQVDLDRHGRWAAALLAAAEKALAAGRTPEALDLVKRARVVPGHERDPRAMDLWRTLGATAIRAGLRSIGPVRTLRALTPVSSVAVSADGRIACGAGGGVVRLWDTASGAQIVEWEDDGSGGVGLPGGGRRVVASGRQKIVMRSAPAGHWPVRLDTDPRDGLRGRRGVGVTGDRGTASVSAAGLVLAACMDTGLRMWDITEGECVRTLPGHGVQVNSVWLDPDARRAVSAHYDGSVRVWDIDAGTHVTVSQPGAWVSSVCLGADGRYVLNAGEHEGWTLWLTDAVTGRFVRGFGEVRDDEKAMDEDDEPCEVWVARLSSDGRFAFSGDGEGYVHIWETATGRRIRTLEGHAEEVQDLALTPDDRLLLSGSADGTVHQWELDWELAASEGEGEASR
ncbi:protein kinase [Streptomyces sp. NPDC050421]|uniref:protein kinase domain-containing protein n=1 Tax=Streptomyces sp. NPDC050421 TaxID=3365613 RepID=UPI0037A7F1D7